MQVGKVWFQNPGEKHGSPLPQPAKLSAAVKCRLPRTCNWNCKVPTTSKSKQPGEGTSYSFSWLPRWVRGQERFVLMPYLLRTGHNLA